MIREKFGDKIIAWVLKANPDGWVLSQRGNHYDFEPLERDEKNARYRVGDGDEEGFLEDHLGKMHHLNGVPIGLHLEDARQVVDVEDAAVATAFDDQVDDAGELELDTQLTPEEIMQFLDVGTVRTNHGTAKIVNPYLAQDDVPDLVDLRDTMRLHRNAADPQTPLKAAQNAVEAERATQGMDWGNAAQIGGMIGAFLIGAITVEYIAGGSGGGGVSVGLMISMLSTML